MGRQSRIKRQRREGRTAIRQFLSNLDPGRKLLIASGVDPQQVLARTDAEVAELIDAVRQEMGIE